MWLSLLTAGIQMAGAYTAFQQQRDQARMYEQETNAAAGANHAAAMANARMAERNAQAARMDAAAARLSSLRRSEDILMFGRVNRGELSATAAARGVQADTGSPLEALAADAYETGRVASEEMYTGLLAARDLDIEAINYRYQADTIKSQATFARAFASREASRARKQAMVSSWGGLAQGITGGMTTIARGFAQPKPMTASVPTMYQPVQQYNSLPFQMPPGE